MESKYKYFLQDFCKIMHSKALEAKDECLKNNDDYNKGRLIVYHDLITTLQQQADAFGIDHSEINIDNIVPDKDLLS